MSRLSAEAGSLVVRYDAVQRKIKDTEIYRRCKPEREKISVDFDQS